MWDKGKFAATAIIIVSGGMAFGSASPLARVNAYKFIECGLSYGGGYVEMLDADFSVPKDHLGVLVDKTTSPWTFTCVTIDKYPVSVHKSLLDERDLTNSQEINCRECMAFWE